ncbi:ATP-dependent zinc metalloprotease FtsH [Ktedonospora formicarum]|uniref:ATP-dependent zinc metalloprotease FtsH n=1 Tax=Ktedonospora formicarum TaxID=2778364 RepID=A0A8J3IA23_9CHLR|nr:ATP-dependent zinc metalloprotease FtsH [Ktedonospora formicarum]GHO50191.1 ATP-dependent zinc metalloprotease FtsH [Ktedonospora formicarum]
MDDNAGRHNKLPKWNGQRRRPVEDYGRKAWQFFRGEQHALWTVALLVALLALSFAVASQLRPPIPTIPTSNGEMAISYSGFVQMVEEGNVLAVNIRGNEIRALLSQPAQVNSKQAGTSISQQNQDVLVWDRYVSTGNSADGKALDSERALHTQMPVNGDGRLMPLLLSKHIQVRTLPVTQVAVWLMYLWRSLPFLVFALVMFVYFWTRKHTNLEKSIDQRVSQLGKSRARRFERVKEGSSRRDEEYKDQARSSTTLMNSESMIRARTARLSSEKRVTFADVAGIDEVREELEEIVQFLRAPERYNKLGARIPCGALLVGPPGTGKTLLARAVAGEARVPFFSMSASEFVEMFVGVGASRVRDLFNQARQASPSVVFIDEIDAVGRKRSMRMGGNDERDQTLNQLLVELDGFDERHAVVVMAATNRADILDNALLRPGRFDRRIMVSPPDRVGREAILRVHTRKNPLDPDVSLERLARMTTGMTGADLANLVNESALVAARRNLDTVSHQCFEDALARVQLGALRPLVMNEHERRIIAVHEAGHALVAHYLPAADAVNRVTILPRGQSLGVTQFINEDDRYNYSREYLMAKIAVGLGGRVAEELTFGMSQVTTGAENDFQVVTNLAKRMVTRWGMSQEVGLVFADHQAEEGSYAFNMDRQSALPGQTLALDGSGKPVWHSDFSRAYHAANPQPAFVSPQSPLGSNLKGLVDAEITRLIDEGHALATRTLSEHNEQLHLLADALIEHEALDCEHFELLVGKKQI